MLNTTRTSLSNPFPALFVDAPWLEQHLHDPALRILQIGGENYYPQFHIPGAHLVSYRDLVTTRDAVPGMRAETGALCTLFGQAGITLDTPVLAYDVGGGMDAARAVWTLASLGHTALAILEGSFGIWYRENRPMQSDRPSVQVSHFQPSPNPAWEATAEDVLEATRAERGVLLLDTRTPQEYQGLTAREPRGHMAGALPFHWVDALRDGNDPRLLATDTLRAAFAERGLLEPQQEVIVYCETGHRASHTWLLLQQLGFSRARLYDGSMAEWRVLGYPVVAGMCPR
ncbi:MAG: rhodanese-like domain-containing protein [Magnetococcus sp. MYC-9]